MSERSKKKHLQIERFALGKKSNRYDCLMLIRKLTIANIPRFNIEQLLCFPSSSPQFISQIFRFSQNYKLRKSCSASEFGMRNGRECKIDEKNEQTHTHRHMQEVYSWMEKKITKTLHWWWSAKKANGEVTMWSDPVARRKIGNNKNTAATANTAAAAVARANRRDGDETPLRIWLISQSYSFPCEAQMLHLWITIKRAYWLRRHEASKRDTRTERTANRQRIRDLSCVRNIIFTVIVTCWNKTRAADERFPLHPLCSG